MKQRKLKIKQLSQIKFPHWWKDRAFIQLLAENKIPIEEQKAAVWYEAARRRPEVQEAWVKGQFLMGANGWQQFTAWVVENLPESWPELEVIVKAGLIKSSYSLWSVPPAGYSTFPTGKAEQMKVSLQVLHLPEAFESFDQAKKFLEHVRKFVDAGFEIVAVDNKTKQGIRYACKAIESLKRSVRKADVKKVILHHLPPDISEADRQEMAEKERKGILTEQDFNVLWRKYIKPTSNPHDPWHKTASIQERVLHKRERKGKLIEGIQFNFENICHQLESFDNGTISDFINAVRL